ncbi:MAG: glycosyltransferase family 39 protein [Anaerolineaceae bacterium]|nr:glycosyltransferase family 39 protein [Anaerolineaceae bacterium]
MNKSERIRTEKNSKRQSWLSDILILLIVIAAIYLRFIGLNWDQNAHLHPDERFLTMVVSSISTVSSISDYFNTDISPLNPHNVGFNFFVYGTLPLFIVRYIAEVFQKTGYDQIFLVGRQLSALADILTVLVVYWIGRRLYGKPVGLIAAALAAFSVVPIQQSHFFTVDTFANLFGFLAVYQVVCLVTPTHEEESGDGTLQEKPGLRLIFKEFKPYGLFALAVGMAVASKINAGALVILLPMAVLLRYGVKRSNWPITRTIRVLIFLGLAGLICLLTFRVFQPYSFSGPGFLDFNINHKWWANIQELNIQSSGKADFPPALQWANRPLWFAWLNTILWGMGLPFGLVGVAAFLWMGWRIINGEWKPHILLWIWTGLYSLWQGLAWVRAMRYQMLIYPSTAILVAWLLVSIWKRAHGKSRRKDFWQRVLAVGLMIITIGGSFAWAFAFTRIYSRPVTRLAASEWIMENIPGPINLQLMTADGEISQPLAYRAGMLVEADKPYQISFRAQTDDVLTELVVPHLAGDPGNTQPTTIQIVITPISETGNVLARSVISDLFATTEDLRGNQYAFPVLPVIPLEKGMEYLITVSVPDGMTAVNMSGPISLTMESDMAIRHQVLPVTVQQVRAGQPYAMGFTPMEVATVQTIVLPHVVDQSASRDNKKLKLIINPGSETCQNGLADAAVSGLFPAVSDPRGGEVIFRFDQPLALDPGIVYTLQLCLVEGDGALAVYGSSPALESSWDDALPYNVKNISAYAGDQYSGIYRGDLNLELYWDDTPVKLDNFLSTLDQADTIFISSNRQWGTTTRVPERYPLTSAYYRNLLGCPDDREIVWCYNVAEPGMFSGQFGFELVKTFTSYPNLGVLQFNDQFAEEAFTVYDHPKVLIFRKTMNYDPQRVYDILSAVDISNIIHLIPKDAGKIISENTLMLSEERLAAQREGGTWSDLFSRTSLINRSPLAGIVAWYLMITLLGWFCYPIVRLAFPGLPDRGYPLSRMTGLLLLALPVWLAASLGAEYGKTLISLVLAGIALLGVIFGYVQRKSLWAELKVNWKYYLTVELVCLVLFLIFLAVRMGNPDLWHPSKGGEKPMDFSYFNAVLKSTSFPPYDPWLSGGYINYYYYGFVIIGTPVKWLGLIPSFAYNLILPTLFSLLGLGAYSLGWNLVSASQTSGRGNASLLKWLPGLGGISAVLGTAVFGNLATLRMIWHGLQRLVAPGGSIIQASLLQRIGWTFKGLMAYFKEPFLPFYPGDWYWIPSRAIGDGPITEFPAFTFLYADLHAHLIALPVTLLVLAWVVSTVLGKSKYGDSDGRHYTASLVLSLSVGAVAIGSLRPTNTWDYPTYLVLTAIALLYTTIQYGWPRGKDGQDRHHLTARLILAVILVGTLILAAQLLYQPFSQWFTRLVGSNPWQGETTPIWSYLTHWGLFLFVIVSWLAWETYHWMDTTPLRKVSEWRRHAGWLFMAGAIVLSALIALTFLFNLEIGWLVLLLGVWIVFLLFVGNLSDAKRIVMFLTGSALALSLAVELIVLKDDIGRMNTVFKFYLQAWSLFAVSSAAALAWTLRALRRWNRAWQTFWQITVILLVAVATLFPLTATKDKVTDRMAPATPISLDGMAFMQYAYYDDMGVVMDLESDYKAIQWMQDHVSGSPVIVEGNTPEYRWGSRFTIYTGLPGVVGWNWHQRQQRAVRPETTVTERIADITGFYTTDSKAISEDFLDKYEVSYIIVGQLEHAYYPGTGLDKFSRWNGNLWQEVYNDGLTVIYEVNRN